jgi:7-carboxy-7-deazaguanine synthase
MRIFSIFSSINGEICNTHQGSVCTFVRLAGCSVGCTFCDTKYAQGEDSGNEMTILEVADAVALIGNRNVTITGGEPMEQKRQLVELISLLLDNPKHHISIETSGEVPFRKWEFPQSVRLSFVVDVKLQATMIAHYHPFMHLTNRDFIKMVVGCAADLTLAMSIKCNLQKMGIDARFAISPMEGGSISPKNIIDFLQGTEHSDVILNVQIHKLLDLEEDKTPVSA